MATSSKVLFNLETLRSQALESVDMEIKHQETVVASYADDEALEALVKEWRRAQEARISELFRKLGDDDITDSELSKFKLEPMPKIDIWERGKAQARLRELENTRRHILAKATALVPDEGGNVSLTKLQLREFFGL